MATISTHNGSAVRREHNIRDKRVIKKQTHIKPDGEFEIWHDETLSKAYSRIFGNAVKEYNSKQTRADRKINSYLSKIQNDSKKHACYEMIIGVYGGVDKTAGKNIMREFVDSWQERNPNLELIGAYYHADEEGEPHVHIDYVPIAKGYKRGLSVQNGLDKALTQMGYSTKSINDTAQMQWEKKQNEYFESLCRNYGIEVEHPDREVKQHRHTDIYKADMELKKVEQQLSDTSVKLSEAQNELFDVKGQVDTLNSNLSDLEGKLKAKSDGQALLDLVDKASKELKDRQPYSIEVVAEHKARFSPITKKEVKPETVEVTKKSFENYLQDTNLIELLNRLIERVSTLFDNARNKLRKEVAIDELNQGFVARNKQLRQDINKLSNALTEKQQEYDTLNANHKKLQGEFFDLKQAHNKLLDERDQLEMRFPHTMEQARICQYEHIYDNMDRYASKSFGRTYLPDLDGNEVHIWTFMEKYADECVQFHIEPREDIVEHYQNHNHKALEDINRALGRGNNQEQSYNDYDFEL